MISCERIRTVYLLTVASGVIREWGLWWVNPLVVLILLIDEYIQLKFFRSGASPRDGYDGKVVFHDLCCCTSYSTRANFSPPALRCPIFRCEWRCSRKGTMWTRPLQRELTSWVEKTYLVPCSKVRLRGEVFFLSQDIRPLATTFCQGIQVPSFRTYNRAHSPVAAGREHSVAGELVSWFSSRTRGGGCCRRLILPPSCLAGFFLYVHLLYLVCDYLGVTMVYPFPLLQVFWSFWCVYTYCYVYIYIHIYT